MKSGFRNTYFNMWTVYIIKCKDNSLYTGVTKNLDGRIRAHSSNVGAKYTVGRGPFKIMHTEEFGSRSEAQQREYVIKKLSKKDKDLLIRGQTSSEF